MTLENLEKKINSELTTKIKSSKISYENLFLEIDNEDLIDVVTFLKNNSYTNFKQLIDITAVDYPEKLERFKIVYMLLSHQTNKRIVLSFSINENDHVSSLTKIYPGISIDFVDSNGI